MELVIGLLLLLKFVDSSNRAHTIMRRCVGGGRHTSPRRFAPHARTAGDGQRRVPLEICRPSGTGSPPFREISRRWRHRRATAAYGDESGPEGSGQDSPPTGSRACCTAFFSVFTGGYRFHRLGDAGAITGPALRRISPDFPIFDLSYSYSSAYAIVGEAGNLVSWALRGG